MGRPAKDGRLMSFKLSSRSVSKLHEMADLYGISMTAIIENAVDKIKKEEFDEKTDGSSHGTTDADGLHE